MEHRALQVEFKQDKGNSVFGYAASFDTPTMIRDAAGRSFREIVSRNAFNRTLAEQPDVRLLRDHNPSLLLGRTKAGTLEVGVDDKGLWFCAKLPDTPEAQSLRAAIERKDLDACSFGFNVIKDRWATDQEMPTRYLEDVTLYEVSIVAFPAYEQGTSVDLRSVQLTTSKTPVRKLRAMLKIREAKHR